MVTRLMQYVMSADRTRHEPRKAGVYTIVLEDFEGVSDTVMASAIILHQPVSVSF